MAVVPLPGEFLMGEGADIQPFALGAKHKERIDWSFAIASKAVTVAEFRRFRNAQDKGQDQNFMKQYAPTDECPMIMVTWYDAAAYCNWLSKEEGIPREQWCYEPNEGSPALATT